HKIFRALGDFAAARHVPIHSIAFSPTDERGPLLNLGEISKRSHGTFRWARSADDLRAQVEGLIEELNQQYVLTFRLDDPAVDGKSFVLRCEDLSSDPLVYHGVRVESRRRLRLLLGGLALLLVGC